MTTNIVAQDQLIHYYLELNGSKPDKYKIEFGTVQYEENGKVKKIQIDSVSTLHKFIQVINSNKVGDNVADEVNVIIHGIWGNNKSEWKLMTKNLGNQVYINDDGKKKILVSIIWDSSINYLKGIKIARKKGDYLADFMRQFVLSNQDKKINFLCHSMGNIIMEHMTKGSGLLDFEKPLINHYINAGADIRNDIFESGQTFERMPIIAKNISVYVHNNDRSLKMSKLLNKKKRLGLNGPTSIENAQSNIRTIDVSTINDNHDIASSMSNHRYFYMSPTIMADIKRMIWEEDFKSNKIELDHPRKLKLLPTED